MSSIGVIVNNKVLSHPSLYGVTFPKQSLDSSSTAWLWHPFLKRLGSVNSYHCSKKRWKFKLIDLCQLEQCNNTRYNSVPALTYVFLSWKGIAFPHHLSYSRLFVFKVAQKVYKLNFWHLRVGIPFCFQKWKCSWIWEICKAYPCKVSLQGRFQAFQIKVQVQIWI